MDNSVNNYWTNIQIQFTLNCISNFINWYVTVYTCQKLWKLAGSWQSYCKNYQAYFFWPTLYYLDDVAAAEVAGCFVSTEPFSGVCFRRSLSASR